MSKVGHLFIEQVSRKEMMTTNKKRARREGNELPQVIRDAKWQVKLCDSTDFWGIMDLLVEELAANRGGGGFFHNRETLLEAFQSNRFFVLDVLESDDVFEQRDLVDPHVLPETMYTLRSFCVLDSKRRIEIIWTDPRYRRMGFATAFVDYFYHGKGSGDVGVEPNATDAAKHVCVILSDSQAFWTKMGFTYDLVSHR